MLRINGRVSLNFGIEVEEQCSDAAVGAEVIRHKDGCILLLGGKPFVMDGPTAVRLAWDLCVMFQDSQKQG